MSVADSLFYHTAHYGKDITKMCEPIFDLFGVKQLGMFFVAHNGAIVNVHTNPEWMSYCMEKKYYLDDPHLVLPVNMGSGFSVTSAPKDNEERHILVREVQNRFNLWNSVSFAKRLGCGGYIAFSFDSELENTNMANQMLSNQPAVSAFAGYIEEAARNILKRTSGVVINLQELKGDKLESQMGTIPKTRERPLLDFYTKIGIEADGMDLNISQRELECLDYTFKGYSRKETGEELYITAKTVACHITNLKGKIACKDKRDFHKKVELLKSLGKL
jgi:DNA-binding CsgD family transcriptional regulator